MSCSSSQTVPCLLTTWDSIESELLSWLIKKTHNEEVALDLLQETFLRALQQKKGFCDIGNQKAWLYRVATNLLNDLWRDKTKQKMLAENLDTFGYSDDEKKSAFSSIDSFEGIPFEGAPVDGLVHCLPKALQRLNPDERNIIESCDINGMSQQEFADAHRLSLSATKSRLQRARIKLRNTLKIHCQIRFDEQQRVCCFSPVEIKS